MTRRLIVNADDWGLTRGVSEGILAALETRGFTPAVIATEVQSFPRIGYERLDHLRSLDAEGVLPARSVPSTVERLIIEGRLARS